MVIAVHVPANFAHGGTAEFRRPKPPALNRVSQRSPQVLQESSDGSIDFLADLIERLVEIIIVVAVMIPIGVIELYEANAVRRSTSRLARMQLFAKLGLPGSTP